MKEYRQYNGKKLNINTNSIFLFKKCLLEKVFMNPKVYDKHHNNTMNCLYQLSAF